MANRYAINRKPNSRMPINIGAILGALGDAGVIGKGTPETNPYFGMEPEDVPYTDSKFDARVFKKDDVYSPKNAAGREANAQYREKQVLAKQGQEAAIGLENQRSANQIKEAIAKSEMDEKVGQRAKEEDTRRKLTEEERQFRVIGKQLLEVEGPGDAPYYMADPEQQALFLGQRANVLLGDTFKNKGYTAAEAERLNTSNRIAQENKKAFDEEQKRLQDLRLGKSDLKTDRQTRRFKSQEQPGVLAKQQLEIEKLQRDVNMPRYIPFGDAGMLFGDIPPSARPVTTTPAAKAGYDPDTKSFIKSTAPSLTVGNSVEEQQDAYSRELATAQAKMAAKQALEADITARRSAVAPAVPAPLGKPTTPNRGQARATRDIIAKQIEDAEIKRLEEEAALGLTTPTNRADAVRLMQLRKLLGK